MELINERKLSNEKGEKRDLLSNLVDANEEVLDDGEQRLGEDELIGKRSLFGPVVHSFINPLLRKYLHFLSCRIRGKDTLVIADSYLLNKLYERRPGIPLLSS